MKLGNLEITEKAALAPLAGVADRAFRELCRGYGAAYTVCEMASAKGISLGDKKSAELLSITPTERPAGSQIFGNSPETMAIAAQKALEYKKEFVIGGGVSVMSLPFFQRLPEQSLTSFETRKVIFDAQKILKKASASEGILKALDFELMWIKNKQKYTTLSSDEMKRILILESRYKDSICDFEL
jgi:hypothetical protein